VMHLSRLFGRQCVTRDSFSGTSASAAHLGTWEVRPPADVMLTGLTCTLLLLLWLLWLLRRPADVMLTELVCTLLLLLRLLQVHAPEAARLSICCSHQDSVRRGVRV